MSFWLKKFVSFWLMPVPGCLTLLIIGWWLTRGGRRSWFGRACQTVALVALLLMTNIFVSTWLVRPLEREYPPIPELTPGAPLPPALAECQYVVVLGSGNADVPDMPALIKLSTAGLGRLTEGVRLARLLPHARLIVSGPGYPGAETHAQTLTRAAVSLGIDRARIRQIDTARDTEEESQAVAALVGNAPIALVTSAVHMPRAAALFRHAKVHFLPCPTDFTAKANAHLHGADFLWDSESLDRSTWAVRERIGALWLRLRGKID